MFRVGSVREGVGDKGRAGGCLLTDMPWIKKGHVVSHYIDCTDTELYRVTI